MKSASSNLFGEAPLKGDVFVGDAAEASPHPAEVTDASRRLI